MEEKALDLDEAIHRVVMFLANEESWSRVDLHRVSATKVELTALIDGQILFADMKFKAGEKEVVS